MLPRSALLSFLHRDRLPRQFARRKEQPEHLPEDQFFRQQRYRQREDHPCHHRHECDCHLHNQPPRVREREEVRATRLGMVQVASQKLTDCIYST